MEMMSKRGEQNFLIEWTKYDLAQPACPAGRLSALSASVVVKTIDLL
jgi:hypothetical protein